MLTASVFVFLTLTTAFGDEITVSNNKFAVDVYKAVAPTSGNVIFSPFSAEALLALLETGARGSTAAELRAGLHLTNNRNEIQAEFKALSSSLKVRDSDAILFQEQPYLLLDAGDHPQAHQIQTSKAKKHAFKFHMANKVYLQKSFQIDNNFRRIAEEVFDAEVENVDFRNSYDTATIINNWVERKTNNKIRDLISPARLDSGTKMVLVNALYLKGSWELPFHSRNTRRRNFFKSDRSVVQADMMYKADDDRQFRYAENLDLGAQFLELPIRGDNHVSMVFVLPFKSSFYELEQKVAQVFEPQAYTRQFVNMSIPKFIIENQIDLKEVLLKLGVRQAFQNGRADFSGISHDGLVVNDVIQKTFIDVNEAGVEAAAATFGGVVTLGIRGTPVYKQFQADQPFIYFIKLRELIVFAGKVTEPRY